AIANLGYADVRFAAPVYAGDTITCESSVIGLKQNSNGRSGVVYVKSIARNQEGRDVLSWIRWVMVARHVEGDAPPTSVPALPAEVPANSLAAPDFLRAKNLSPEASGGKRLWDDYAPGEVIDHPGRMMVEEADHMAATRLYQNPGR